MSLFERDILKKTSLDKVLVFEDSSKRNLLADFISRGRHTRTSTFGILDKNFPSEESYQCNDDRLEALMEMVKNLSRENKI